RLRYRAGLPPADGRRRTGACHWFGSPFTPESLRRGPITVRTSRSPAGTGEPNRCRGIESVPVRTPPRRGRRVQWIVARFDIRKATIRRAGPLLRRGRLRSDRKL